MERDVSADLLAGRSEISYSVPNLLSFHLPPLLITLSLRVATDSRVVVRWYIC